MSPASPTRSRGRPAARDTSAHIVIARGFLDDDRVLTASFDGSVRIWTPFPASTAGALAAELRRRAPACLDEELRQTHLGESGAEASARVQACRRAAP